MSTEHDRQLEAALGDYLRRVDAGENVDLNELLSAHPGIAADLASCLQAASVIERMAGRAAREMNGHGGDTSIAGETIDVSPDHLRGSQAPSDVSGGPTLAKLPDGKRTFGRFEIQHELGQGAMGAVYLAFDTRLQRQVALKFPKFSSEQDATLIERFYREARSAATLRHPNICPVFDADCIDGIHFIAMAYIQGRPLSTFIDRRSPPSPRNAALTVRKIARAVHEAHKHGVVHRDLKPSNIIIDDRNEPIVMDFGLARVFDRPAPTSEGRTMAAPRSQSLDQTQEGTIIGTPRYMSPEQARGDVEAVGPASDQFSLGILFYEMLTGRAPFEGASLTTLLSQIVSHEPPPPSAVRSAVDPSLEAICLRMLKKPPQERYASMQEVADALTAAIQRSPLQEADPSLATKLEPSQGSAAPGGRGRMFALLLAAAAMLLAAVIIRVRTADGTLVVEVDGDAEVKVIDESGAIEITRQSDGGKLQLSVAPGKHQLMVEKDGFRAYSEKFEIAAGKATTIRAHLDPVPIAPDAPTAEVKSEHKPEVQPESQREIAIWLLQTGAKVDVVDLSVSGSPLKTHAEATSLPSGPLRIKSLAWEVKDKLPHFSAVDVQRLAQCADLDSVRIENQSLTHADWLAAFPTLRSLYLQGGVVSEGALQSLGRLKNLRRLSFKGYPQGLTPDRLAFLRELPDLEELWFNAATAGDGGLVHLAGSKKLKRLMLWAAGVTDEGIQHLANLPRLEYLELGSNRVTLRGLKSLGEAPALLFLGLHKNSAMNDEAMEGLVGLRWATQLKTLGLADTPITSQGVRSLSALTQLEILDLNRTQIDDQAVPYLVQLADLKELKVDGTLISPNRGSELKQKLPQCKVDYAPEFPLPWHVRYFSWPDAGPNQPPSNWSEVIAAAPLAEVDASRLQHDWGSNAPAANVPADHFALVATSEFEVTPGDYRLEVSSDDGVRVFLDDQPVLEAWTWRMAKTDLVEIALTADFHRLRVEYFDSSGFASLKVRLIPGVPPLPAGFGSEFLVTAGAGAKDIYRYNLAAKEWRNLTNHAAQDVNPVWSRDGQRIAFMSNRDGVYRLFVMDAEGSNLTPIAPLDFGYDASPAWSPGGDKIAVGCQQSPQAGTFVIGVDGTNGKQLSQRPMWDLVWSPDGDRLAFAVKTEAGFRVGTMDVAGGNFRELSTPNPYGWVDPNWSPDGKSLTFVNWVKPNFRICSMDSDGGNLRVLTTTGNGYGPTFSRDGKSILYQERTDEKNAGRVFVINASGGAPQEFAWPSGLDHIVRAPFSWRPDKLGRE